MGNNEEFGGDADVTFSKDNADDRDGYLQNGCGGVAVNGTLLFGKITK